MKRKILTLGLCAYMLYDIFVKPYLKLSMLISYGIAWNITNGWSYIALGLGTFLKIPILITISSTYLAFLWMPFTIEKPITFAIAFYIQKKLFVKEYYKKRLFEEELRIKIEEIKTEKEIVVKWE